MYIWIGRGIIRNRTVVWPMWFQIYFFTLYYKKLIDKKFAAILANKEEDGAFGCRYEQAPKSLKLPHSRYISTVEFKRFVKKVSRESAKFILERFYRNRWKKWTTFRMDVREPEGAGIDAWVAKRQLKHNKRILLHQETEGSSRGSPFRLAFDPFDPRAATYRGRILSLTLLSYHLHRDFSSFLC